MNTELFEEVYNQGFFTALNHSACYESVDI